MPCDFRLPPYNATAAKIRVLEDRIAELQATLTAVRMELAALAGPEEPHEEENR